MIRFVRCGSSVIVESCTARRATAQRDATHTTGRTPHDLQPAPQAIHRTMCLTQGAHSRTASRAGHGATRMRASPPSAVRAQGKSFVALAQCASDPAHLHSEAKRDKAMRTSHGWFTQRAWCAMQATRVPSVMRLVADAFAARRVSDADHPLWLRRTDSTRLRFT